MNWLKPVLDLLGKFRTFFAWIAGYFTGRKVERLKQENAVLKAEIENEKQRDERDKAVRAKWNRIREERRRLRLVNSSNQPQPLRPDEEITESTISLDETGAELRIDRE